MMKRIFTILTLLLSAHISAQAIDPKLARTIGMLIWQNEASLREDLLVFWNPHEPFPSLGIGHFVWQPADKQVAYTQQFPALCTYLQKKGISLPAWLEKAIQTGAPWQSREAFLKDQQRTDELRRLLASTIDLQITFMIEQLEQKWPLIVQAAPADQRKKLERHFALMKATPLGLYALIDYLNFKGSGLNPLESKEGCQWGLLQVLLGMPDNLTQQTACTAFTCCATQLLAQRIQNDHALIRFLHGWIKRVSSYADPQVLDTVQ